ncbi:MAG: MBL fold metallo-hydrolase [Woeseiaceae bacterium]|nr:MBL fold metallo-hydrolase [Woeseiaceae bacterium]
MTTPDVHSFFDEATFTVSYLVADPKTGRAAIIDSVLDFDPASGRTSTRSADAVIEAVKAHDYSVEWVLDTHVHADHLSAANYVRQTLGGKTGIGENVALVQRQFKSVFNLKTLATDGSQFDKLFADNEAFALGNIEASVLHTPGHTPGCVTYVFGDAAFVGDTLFMPDYGTARTDFPGGDAGTLYDAIQRIFSLPDETRLFMCHDYKAPGRDEFAWETTVKAQRESNIHINTNIDRDEFIEMRTGRDANLSMPKLILPSVQVNVCAGALPEPEDNDVRYLKIPLDVF